MYYKITDQSSEVFQKLHELRTKELEIEKANKKAIEEKTGMTWNVFLGDSGQQQFRRVTQYSGFQFHQTDQIDSKIWKKHKKYPHIWVPNTRYKVGREMGEFLRNGLQGSHFGDVIEILELEQRTHFNYPFVEICGDEIILYLGDNHRPKDTISVIEITSVEFDNIRERKEVQNA